MQEHTSGYCRHNDYMKYLLKICVFGAPLQHCSLLNMIKLFHVVILPKCIWHLPGVSKYLEEKMEEKIPEFTHTWSHVMTHWLFRMFPSASIWCMSSCIELLNTYDHSWTHAFYGNWGIASGSLFLQILNTVLYFPPETTVWYCCRIFV